MTKSKKLILLVTILAMVLTTSWAYAAPTKKQKPVTKNKYKVAVNSKMKVSLTNLDKKSTVIGYKVSGKILVPTKQVVEFFGGKVNSFASKTNEANILIGNKNIKVATVKVINKVAYADASKLGSSINVKYDSKSNTFTRTKVDVVIPMWSSIRHNYKNIAPITDSSPAKNDAWGCIKCHNGIAFANELTTNGTIDFNKDDVSIGCGVCHSQRGTGIMASGETAIFDNGYQITGVGTSALCITCHHDRNNGPSPESKAAPHPGTQADVVFGFGGYEYSGVSYPSSPHAASPSTCVGCHMAIKNGVKSHDLKVANNAENACGICHKGLTTVNRTALGDFDGNKKISGIQDEVQGLILTVQKAILDKAGVEIRSEYGQIVFKDVKEGSPTNGQDIAVEDKYYYAAWNVFTAQNEGSKGIHNPAYIVKLLQSSYKDIMGYDVPNAMIR